MPIQSDFSAMGRCHVLGGMVCHFDSRGAAGEAVSWQGVQLGPFSMRMAPAPWRGANHWWALGCRSVL
ncbi:MAG: hypothetical protein GY869_23915 [Planctomycetes bacterium]|nr:hypothetical protein [Planctomycetota bacterium]